MPGRHSSHRAVFAVRCAIKKVERIDGHTLSDEIGTNLAPGSILMTD